MSVQLLYNLDLCRSIVHGLVEGLHGGRLNQQTSLAGHHLLGGIHHFQTHPFVYRSSILGFEPNDHLGILRDQ